MEILLVVLVVALLLAALPVAHRVGRQSAGSVATADLARLEALLHSERSQRAEADREHGLERERLLAALVAERVEAAADLTDARARSTQALAVERGLSAELQVALTNSLAKVASLSATLESERTALGDRFKALSAEVVAASQAEFGRLSAVATGDLDQRRQAVEHLVAPLKDSIAAVSAQVTAAETARVGAAAQLGAQVTAVTQASEQLRRETASLVTALRRPQTRGAWGEMQLRRVVEVAGMLERCDFEEQVTLTSSSGAGLRPDMVVTLAGGATVVVDAKVPLSAFLEASEAPDEVARASAMRAHSRQVREHVRILASKEYASALTSSPEFVVLFIPGESFLAAALEADPELMEVAARDKVVIATPTTLLALLRTVAYGWQQTVLAEGAMQVSQAGRELYERLAVFAGHLAKAGRGLSTAVGAYNEAVGSMDARVLPAARRLRDLEVVDGTTAPIVGPLVVEADPRSVTAPEVHVLSLVPMPAPEAVVPEHHDPLTAALADHLAELPVLTTPEESTA